MSEIRKRCPKGEHYNKETKRCEPKGEMLQRVSTARARTARSKSSKSKSPSSKSSSSKSSSSKSPSSKSSSSLSALTASINSFILHEGGDSYRLLVSIPVNNHALWPNPNICFFRTTGRSNKNSEIFTGSWFPIAGIKESSTMPKYLEDKSDGFLIKMAFIMNKKDDFSGTDKQPKWISDLIDDYPIILEESEKSLFDEKRSITIKEFIEKNKYEKSKTSTVIVINYERIAKEIDNILNEGFTRFLNYFLYEWQAMLSLRIGGGYWKLNPVFAEYISRKLSSFDLVPVPRIDLHLCTIKTPTLSAVMSEQGAADCTFKMRNGVKEMSEEKLGEIYFKQNNNREPNRGHLTIDFSKRAGTQLSMMQITAIKNEEEEKLNSTAGKSTSQIINFSEMEKKYIMPIMQYLNSVKRLKMFNERYGSKI